MVWVGAGLVKLLLWPSYHSTDFEVHRNWLAVTSSREAAWWYADAQGQSEWTLDYPPLFAWFERLLTYGASTVEAAMLLLSPTPYFSDTTRAYQRATVIASDALLALGAHACARVDGA